MAARYESLFLISRFQAELDRLFQEAMQIGESDLPLGEWQPPIDVVETPAVVRSSPSSPASPPPTSRSRCAERGW